MELSRITILGKSQAASLEASEMAFLGTSEAASICVHRCCPFSELAQAALLPSSFAAYDAQMVSISSKMWNGDYGRDGARNDASHSSAGSNGVTVMWPHCEIMSDYAKQITMYSCIYVMRNIVEKLAILQIKYCFCFTFDLVAISNQLSFRRC